MLRGLNRLKGRQRLALPTLLALGIVALAVFSLRLLAPAPSPQQGRDTAHRAVALDISTPLPESFSLTSVREMTATMTPAAAERETTATSTTGTGADLVYERQFS